MGARHKSDRIHQRDAWRCPGKPEPKWLRIVKGKDYYCLHPDCSADGVNGPLFPRRNKYWVHLREKHWNREIFVSVISHKKKVFHLYLFENEITYSLFFFEKSIRHLTVPTVKISFHFMIC